MNLQQKRTKFLWISLFFLLVAIGILTSLSFFNTQPSTVSELTMLILVVSMFASLFFAGKVGRLTKEILSKCEKYTHFMIEISPTHKRNNRTVLACIPWEKIAMILIKENNGVSSKAAVREIHTCDTGIKLIVELMS